MKGRIADHHILMDVDFVVPDRSLLTVEMVVDTGYVGTITLPSAISRRIGPHFLRNMTANLADGSAIAVDVYVATIVWHGFEQSVEVILLEDRPLLGMVLLDGSQMSVHFENGGLVQLDELG